MRSLTPVFGFVVFLLLVLAAARFTGTTAAEAKAPQKPGLFQALQEKAKALENLPKQR